jgi:uncharacterized protein YcsI (UPF0317 family)
VQRATERQFTELAQASGAEARASIRAGGWRGPTGRLSRGYVQANLVVLPETFAESFRDFCRLNPRPCPLLEVTDRGSAQPKRLAVGADLRTDLPRYRVYVDGIVQSEPESLEEVWRPDFVAFLLGCSFTFEAALARAGVPLRHVELGCNVAMYRTNQACQPAGPFHGPLVVSMRPIPQHLVGIAEQVTARFSRAHGAPVHVGDPGALGIADLGRPDYGDPVPLREGEVPVFWACGVTPQASAEAARVPLMISHAPGCMFITDLRDEDLADAQ